MNISDTCLDCGKNYVTTRANVQTTCPHCASNSNQSSEETLAIKRRLQLILKQEQEQEQEQVQVQVQVQTSTQNSKKERALSLWKRLIVKVK